MSADPAREAARHPDGRFGSQPSAESELSLPAGAPGALNDDDRDRLRNMKGVFENGYTEDDINRVLGSLTSARVVCVWEKHDDYGTGGDSYFLARAHASQPSGRGEYDGPWVDVHPDLNDYLFDPQSSVDVDDLDTLLDETEYDGVDPDDMPGDGRSNCWPRPARALFE